MYSYNAACNGNIKILNVHTHGCHWNENTSHAAVSNGHIECLKYLHENGCPWDEWTCFNSAEGGHLECLKYAHENGESTCSSAAQGGYLDCLKCYLECLEYAHENGCPWNESTCSSAAKGGTIRPSVECCQTPLGRLGRARSAQVPTSKTLGTHPRRLYRRRNIRPKVGDGGDINIKPFVPF